MFISELYENKKPVISLEIFPPKPDSSIESILKVLEDMTTLTPDFISVTYGALGSAQTINFSQMIASTLKNQYHTEALFHLTCVNASKEKINDIITCLKNLNIQNILALSGDAPQGGYKEPQQDYHFATDLIADIKSHGDFCVGAACYPEGHIDCPQGQNDYDHLKQKEAAGADFFISQLFFENRYFLDFVEQARKKGITKPLVAGIMPIMSKNQVDRMIYTCGVSLPAGIIKLLHRYQDNPEDLRKAGLEYAMKQATDLVKQGVDGIHLYTMNRPATAHAALEQLRK